MKILYLSDHTPIRNSFIRQDVERISKYHDVYYFGFLSDELKSKHYRTKCLKYPYKSIKSKIFWVLEKKNLAFTWKNRKFSKALSNEIEKINPDIIHCQFIYESAKLIQNYSANCPVIVNVRGYGASHKLQNPKYIKWVKKIAQNKNVFPIFVCEYLRKNLTNHNIKFINKSFVLHTGVDTEFFKRTKWVKNLHPILIQVSSFDYKKGQEITIEAFNKLIKNSKYNKSKLIFIGSGPNENRCKKLVKELKLSDNVVFKGFCDREEIKRSLNSADIFVHHSITDKNSNQEGIPNSIIEAMSMEMPILSSFHGGITEAVEHKINGLLCLENDLDKYFKNMLEILSWNFLKVNRERAIKKFNIKSHINKLINIYDTIT